MRIASAGDFVKSFLFKVYASDLLCSRYWTGTDSNYFFDKLTRLFLSTAIVNSIGTFLNTFGVSFFKIG